MECWREDGGGRERADGGWWSVGGRMVEGERGQTEGGGVLDGGWWRERGQM